MICPEPQNHFLLLCLRVYKDTVPFRSADVSLALSLRGERYSPTSCPIHNHCQGGSTWCLQNSRPQRCGSDHNRKCHLALSLESTPLPWKCVAASIPIPGSLREWQECHGDVNGDIRSHSRQRTTAQGGRGCQLLGAGGHGGSSLSSVVHRCVLTSAHLLSGYSHKSENVCV